MFDLHSYPGTQCGHFLLALQPSLAEELPQALTHETLMIRELDIELTIRLELYIDELTPRLGRHIVLLLGLYTVVLTSLLVRHTVLLQVQSIVSLLGYYIVLLLARYTVTLSIELVRHTALKRHISELELRIELQVLSTALGLHIEVLTRPLMRIDLQLVLVRQKRIVHL